MNLVRGTEFLTARSVFLILDFGDASAHQLLLVLLVWVRVQRPFKLLLWRLRLLDKELRDELSLNFLAVYLRLGFLTLLFKAVHRTTVHAAVY